MKEEPVWDSAGVERQWDQGKEEDDDDSSDSDSDSEEDEDESRIAANLLSSRPHGRQIKVKAEQEQEEEEEDKAIMRAEMGMDEGESAKKRSRR